MAALKEEEASESSWTSGSHNPVYLSRALKEEALLQSRRRRRSSVAHPRARSMSPQASSSVYAAAGVLGETKTLYNPKYEHNAGLLRAENVERLKEVFVIRSQELAIALAEALTGRLLDSANRTTYLGKIMRCVKPFSVLVEKGLVSKVSLETLAKGTFGKVHTVQVHHGEEDMQAVVKIPREAGTESRQHAALDEIIVHLVLSLMSPPFIAAARRLLAEKTTYFGPATMDHVERFGVGIPAVHYVTQYGYGKKEGPVAIVQRYDRDLSALFGRSPLLPEREIIGVLRSIAQKLSVLQHVAQFMHRDLHVGNVVVNVDEDKSTVTDVAFIDFGQACFNLIACGMNCQVTDGSINIQAPSYGEGKTLCENPSHDLRMLLASVYFLEFAPDECKPVRDAYPNLHNFLQNLVVRHAMLQKTWRRTYRRLDTVDDAFLPHHVSYALAKIKETLPNDAAIAAAVAAAVVAAGGGEGRQVAENPQVTYYNHKERRRRWARTLPSFESQGGTYIPQSFDSQGGTHAIRNS